MTDPSTYSSRPTPTRTHSKDISTATAFYSSSTSRPIHPPPSMPSGSGGHGYGYYTASPTQAGGRSKVVHPEGKETSVLIESPRKVSKSKLDVMVITHEDVASCRESNWPQTATLVEGRKRPEEDQQLSRFAAENSLPGHETFLLPNIRRSPSKHCERSQSPTKRTPRSDAGSKDLMGEKPALSGVATVPRSVIQISSRQYGSERMNVGDITTELGIGVHNDFGDESILISSSPNKKHNNISDQYLLLSSDEMDLRAVDSSFAQMIAEPAKRRAGSIKSVRGIDREFTAPHPDQQNADESIMWDDGLDKRDSSPAKRLSAVLPRSPSSRSLAQTLAGDENIKISPMRIAAFTNSPSKSKRRIDSGVGNGATTALSRWEEEQIMARIRVEEIMKAQEQPLRMEDDVFGATETPAKTVNGIVRSPSSRSVGERSTWTNGTEISTHRSRSRESPSKTLSRHHGDDNSSRRHGEDGLTPSRRYRDEEAGSCHKPVSPSKSREVDSRHEDSRSPLKHKPSTQFASPLKSIQHVDRSDGRISSPRHAPDTDHWFPLRETLVQSQTRDESYDLDRSTILPGSPSIRRNMASVAEQRDLREESIYFLERSANETVPPVDSMLDCSTILPASPSIRRNIGLLMTQTDLRDERLDEIDLGALDESMLLTSPPGMASVFDERIKRPHTTREPLKHQIDKRNTRSSPLKPDQAVRDLIQSPTKPENSKSSRPLPAPPRKEYAGDETVVFGMTSPSAGDETFFNLMATGDKSLDMLKGMGGADESMLENFASLNHLSLPKPKAPTDTPKRSKQSVSRILPVELTSSPMRQTPAKLSTNGSAVGDRPKERGTWDRTKITLAAETDTPRTTQRPRGEANGDFKDGGYSKITFQSKSSKSATDVFKNGAFASPPPSSTKERQRMLDDILAQATPHGMNSVRHARAGIPPPVSTHKLERTPAASRVLAPSGPPRTNPPQSARKETRPGSTIVALKPRSGEVRSSDGPAEVEQRGTTAAARSLTSVAQQPRLPSSRPGYSSTAPPARPSASKGRPLPTVPSVALRATSTAGVRSKKEGVSPEKMLTRPSTSATTLPRGMGRVPSASTGAVRQPPRSVSSQSTTIRPSAGSTATSRIPGPSRTSIPTRITSGARTSAVPQPGGSRVASASLASKSRQGLPKPASVVEATRPQVLASRISSRPAVTGSKASASSVMAYAEQVLAGKNKQMVASARERR